MLERYSKSGVRKMRDFTMMIGLPSAKYISTMNKNIVMTDDIDFAIDTVKSGRDIVYNDTNLRRKNRKHILSLLPDCKKRAVLFWSKPIDEKESEMLRNFQPPYYDEGFDIITIIYTSTLYTQKDYEQWVDCDHDNPHHPNTVARHMKQVYAEVENYEKCLIANNTYTTENQEICDILQRTALLHDIGKKETKTFVNKRGETTEIAHFYDHYNVGSYYVLGLEENTKLSLDKLLKIAWLVNVHMEPFFNSKYYRQLSNEMRQMVDLFHSFDIAGA